MMKKNWKARKNSRLHINRSTVRRLSDQQIRGVAGGGKTVDFTNCNCDSTSTSNPTTG